VCLFVGQVVGYFVVLASVSYGPPRYFVPLVAPLAALIGLGCSTLSNTRALRIGHRCLPVAWTSTLLALMLAGVMTSGAARIVGYFRDLRYSMPTMLRDVERLVDARDRGHGRGLVLGNFADTLALETGLRAMNTRLGAVPLAHRLQAGRPRPEFVLAQADTAELKSLLQSLGAELFLLGRWDVYGNYYGDGQPVSLFAIDWK
jgi:hypothetical protein